MDDALSPDIDFQVLQPPSWPKPRGYANGIAATGRTVFVGGQIGWDETGTFREKELAGQTRQTLANIVAVLREAGAGPANVTRLTWYVTDIADYRERQREIGRAYQEVMGRHYPAMTLVQVVSLAEPEALVEIEATAVVP